MPAAGSQEVKCSIHGKPMKRRSKDGDTWYSHRLGDGTWCKGKPGDQPGGRVDVTSLEYRRRYATQFGIEFGPSRPSNDDPHDEEDEQEPESAPAPALSQELPLPCPIDNHRLSWYATPTEPITAPSQAAPTTLPPGRPAAIPPPLSAVLPREANV